MHEVVWEVDAGTWEAICQFTEMRENTDISEADYLDKLRSLGMPQGVRPGANLRIVHAPARTMVTVHRPAGRPLPGLPS